MGDIADMILEKLLDEETWEYIGDRNLRHYGKAAPGFPIFYNRRHVSTKKEPCPICGKRIVAGGPPMQQHLKAKHGA